MKSQADIDRTTTTTDYPLSADAVRRRLDRLVGIREEKMNRLANNENRLKKLNEILSLAEPVTEALKSLSDQLFRQELSTVEQMLTHALQEVLEQPIKFKATPDFKSGSAIVDFYIERDGHLEDVQRGQGGSVQNILSVGLRMLALATLGKNDQRGFLILDEQDCWLRPELVPQLVRIVKQAGDELGFQILMISHHHLNLFDNYADQVIRLDPKGSTVTVHTVNHLPANTDQ